MRKDFAKGAVSVYIEIDKNIEYASLKLVWAGFRLILINLLTNALKFSRHGSSVLVHASFDRAQSLLVISVKDEGIGINGRDVRKLFKPLSKPNLSYRHQIHQGAGLGLYMCKKLCKEQRGGIKVESTVGSGSSFTFTICASILDHSGGKADQRSHPKRRSNSNEQ